MPLNTPYYPPQHVPQTSISILIYPIIIKLLSKKGTKTIAFQIISLTFAEQ